MSREQALTDEYAIEQREKLLELEQRAYEKRADQKAYWRIKREQNALTDWFRAHAWSIASLREDEAQIQRLIREWRAVQPYVVIVGINIIQEEKQTTIVYECTQCAFKTISPRVAVYHQHRHNALPSQIDSHILDKGVHA